MNSDLWSSRLAAAKRHYNLQHHHHQQQHLRGSSQFDRINIDDFEVFEDGEVRHDIPCPYCYEDFDIASLCSHLEDDHSFESTPTACPICSSRVARDMLSHISLQHAHLFKIQRRRRLRRVGIPNSQALPYLGRDLREAHLQVLLGSSGFRLNNAHVPSIAADPFLSSLALNVPESEVDKIKSISSSIEDSSVKSKSSPCYWKSSIDSSLSNEERERRIKQAAGRAGFVQDLLLCTLLED